MSQIESVAAQGYAFTASLRNPYAAYASLATGLSVTQVTPGVYRCDTGSLTGVVYVEMTAGALRVVGFANLSSPGANGYSEVFDSLAEAEARGGSDVADDIAEINAKIQTGVINIISPVNADGSINPLVIGDDYIAAQGRAIDLFVDPISGLNVVDCSCTFGGEAAHRGSWLVPGVVSLQTVDGQPKWRMRFELAEDDTRDCKPGCYAWGATLQPPARRATKITGSVELIESHTL